MKKPSLYFLGLILVLMTAGMAGALPFSNTIDFEGSSRLSTNGLLKLRMTSGSPNKGLYCQGPAPEEG